MHPSMKNSVVMFHASDTTECTTCPTDPTGCKKPMFRVTRPDALFVESISVPPEHKK
jgi:hypothetical protein